MIGRNSSFRLVGRVCGVLAFATLIFASLLLPPRWEQLRTGHWEVEHFLAYFAAVPIIYLGWPRLFLVAVVLVPLAALLEVVQCFEPDHSANFLAALSSVGGVLTGTLLVALIIQVRSLASSKRETS